MIISEVYFIFLLLIAASIAIAVRYIKLPYTIALVIVGLILGYQGSILEIELSKDLIFYVFLPPLLFEGAININFDNLKQNFRSIALLSVIGLILSTLIVGFLVNKIIGMPLLYALLFGAMIMPTDPISVLALFKKMGVSKDLSIIVEGESLFNDGTGVVLFELLLAAIVTGYFSVVEGILEFFWIVVGGLLVGFVLGYIAFKVLQNLDDHLIEVLLTIILAYGTFIISEYLHVSGVMGVVAAGLLIGNHGTAFAMSPTTRISINLTWEMIAFIVNSLIFLLIGMKISFGVFHSDIWLVLISIAIVLFARMVSVYPLMYLVNRTKKTIPTSWQHIIMWGGLHGSIPIALVLGLSGISYIKELSIMVFGVVLFSLVFQGLSMSKLIKILGVRSVSEEEVLYEEALARKVAVKKAKAELQKLYDTGQISKIVFEELKERYSKEAARLKNEIVESVNKYDVVKTRDRIVANRKLLLIEKNSILDSIQSGLVSEEVGKKILEDINEKLDALE